jgi:hypothetical protein
VSSKAHFKTQISDGAGTRQTAVLPVCVVRETPVRRSLVTHGSRIATFARPSYSFSHAGKVGHSRTAYCRDKASALRNRAFKIEKTARECAAPF